jgi:hypothetical protein
MRVEQIADRAMICAAIRFANWTRPDKIPPIEMMAKVREHELMIYAGRKSFDVLLKRMSVSGVDFRRVSEKERSELDAERMARAAELIARHLQSLSASIRS